MSTNICSYEGCLVRRLPCSSIAFFSLPTDIRREQWIKNSGNPNLKSLGPKQSRVFCENHFRATDIQSQFNRKTLRKDAVPIPYQPLFACDTEKSHLIDKNNTSTFMMHLPEANNYSSKIEILDPKNQYDLELNEHFGEGSLCVEVLSQLDPIDTLHIETIPEFENTNQNTYSTYDADNIIMEQSHDVFVADDVQLQQVISELQNAIDKPEDVANKNGSCTAEEIDHNRNTFNEDRHFALSLVGYFQRLSHDKKAIAKLKILSYLTDLELNKKADL